jgi:hypothetical protein
MKKIVLKNLETELLNLHGEQQKKRIKEGLKQVSKLWKKEDGSEEDFKNFVLENFISDEDKLNNIFCTFEKNIEQINGITFELSRFLREPLDLNVGELSNLDDLFLKYDLQSHIMEDFYKSKIAFLILLNFKQYSFEKLEKIENSLSRENLAKIALVDTFSYRIPVNLEQKLSDSLIEANNYISNYNIYINNIIDSNENNLFKKELKLISHWGLRDEIQNQYNYNGGLEKQRLIHNIMNKIIKQELPKEFINNKDYIYKYNDDKNNKEDITRYEKLLNVFLAEKEINKYYLNKNSLIDNKFNLERQMSKDKVKEILEEVLTAPVLKDVAAYISKKLNRPLEPFDIWYNGFTKDSGINEDELDPIIKQKYPNVKYFQNDLENILSKLKFCPDFLKNKITVDNGRGCGHAMEAHRKEDNAHIRIRFDEDGLTYKNFVVAMHELGHAVEQVFSLNYMDHYLLAGVPNTAFTECFAFIFQNKVSEILELPTTDNKNLYVLDLLWETFEISGVAMTDIEIWEWLCNNEKATAQELKEAVLNISKNVWNKYFSSVLGIKDQVLLSIYSHIIDCGLYTPDYPLGLIIKFQLESYLKNKSLSEEMFRMCKIGSVSPNLWMNIAVGESISASSLIEAAKKAINEVH